MRRGAAGATETGEMEETKRPTTRSSPESTRLYPVRLAPYLRYYASHRPTDDHGARPASSSLR